MEKVKQRLQTVILVVDILKNEYSVYSSFKKACINERFPYHSLKSSDFPILNYFGFNILKLNLNNYGRI